MHDDIWMIDCLESIILLATKLGQLLEEFEPVAIDFLNLFIRFIHHTEPAIAGASVLATAALLYRMPGLRSESVFTSEGGAKGLFDQLCWIGSQDNRRMSEVVAKLFGFLLKEPYIEIFDCHQIGMFIVTVLNKDPPRLHVLRLLSLAIYHPQFFETELWCDIENKVYPDVMATFLHRYDTFTVTEKTISGYVFANFLEQLPYEVIKWFFVFEEDGRCYFIEVLENLL
jgi:hypothetical protein